MQLFHFPQCPIEDRNAQITVLYGALWDMEKGILKFVKFVYCIV